MRAIAVVTASLMLALVVRAQLPVGHATPSSGYAPALFGEPLWLGNPGYGYRIQGAPPGAAAFIAISARRQDQLVSGLQVYVSLDAADILLTHSLVTDATGVGTVSIPLLGPDIPSLAGLTAYAQAAVADPASPGSYATSEGLLLEVDLHPRCLITNFATDPALVDPVAGTTVQVTGLPAGTQVSDAVFGNGGRDLFLASNNGLFLVDTLAPGASAGLLVAGPWTSVAWDRVHHRLYALYASFNPSPTNLMVVQGNRASPAFGSIITQMGDPSYYLALSSDGTVLALSTFQGALERRDADPSSASYLQVIPTAPSPIVYGFGIAVGRVQLSPDGRVASILETNGLTAHSAIHRFDGLTGQWIDHDAATPGYQPLSSTTHPLLPARFTLLAS